MSRRPLALQRISRRGLISSAVLAGVLSASGVAVQARERRGVLRLGLSGSLPGWDPRAGRGSLARVALSGAVYETLTEITAAGELTGELAESWEPGEGAAVWTVTLRGGTAFHDGSPVTAGDVIASLALHRDGSPAAPILRAVQDMRALTPRQIRFRLDAPDANFPLRLADPHLVVAPGGRFDGIGSGLYRLAEFLPDERLRLMRVDDHWRDNRAGWFEALVLRAMPDPVARTAALIAGHVDAVDFPAGFEARRGLSVTAADGYGVALLPEAACSALAAGLPVVPGAPDEPLIAAAEGYGDPDLGGVLYGQGLDTLVPAAGGIGAVAGHLPFLIGHSDRLRHDGIGSMGPMDSGRIAERWWFA